MVKLKKIILFLQVLFVGSVIQAQENEMLQFFSGISQVSNINPAVQNSNEKLVIGLPLISGFSADWNSNFAPNSIFSNDFSSYSFNRFYQSLEEQGQARFSATIALFYAGLKKDEWNYSFSATDRFYGTTSFDSEIVKLINDGILPYLGVNKSFGSGSFNFRYYRELTWGVSKRIWKQLDLGISTKLLFGKFNFDADDISFDIETTNQQQLLLIPTGSFSIAGPLKYSSNPEIDFNTFSADVAPGDYFFNLRNLGLAADIGFVYRLNQAFELSGSVRDIGFIGFKHKTFDVTFNEPIVYDRNQLFQSNNPENTNAPYKEPKEALKAFGDSVSYNTDITKASFRNVESIPFKFGLKAEYKHSKMLAMGIINQFSAYGKHSVNKFSGFINAKIKTNFEMVGSLTLYNLNGVRIGAGGSYTSQKAQVFVISGNVLSLFQPIGAKDLNLCFGVNLFFTTKN